MEKSKNNTFIKKPVVVLDEDGKEVRRYESLTDFAADFPSVSMATLSKRVKSCLDGWMDDGQRARFADDIHKVGRPLMTCKIRNQGDKDTDRKRWQRELDETEEKITTLYERYDNGEITIGERNAELGWLQNHAEVLRNRIKGKFV